MINLALKKDLVKITLAGGEKVFKACSLENAVSWKSEKKDFILLDGSLIVSSSIFRIEKASDLEVFEIFIRPTLSPSSRDDFDQIASKARARALSLSPSSSVIVSRMEEMQRDREGYLIEGRIIDYSENDRRKRQAKEAILNWKKEI